MYMMNSFAASSGCHVQLAGQPRPCADAPSPRPPAGKCSVHAASVQRRQRMATCAAQRATEAGSDSLLSFAARFSSGGSSNGNLDGTAAAEVGLLAAISGVKGRGAKGLQPAQLEAFNAAVEALEADGGTEAPTRTEQLDGRWRLLFTSKPGTASPIQRTFTGVDAFSIFQDIDLRCDGLPTIVNVVEFGSVGTLRVEAEANTDSRPLPGFTPRKGAGIPLFGRSSTYPPPGPDMRVDFQFSKGTFAFRFLPFTIPYPVPFKALGDETKGFIDVTYLSPKPDGIRLSRGNKGTLFVLQKEGPIPVPGDDA